MTGRTIVGRGFVPLYLLAVVLAPAADAMPAGFANFYGEWVGTAVSDTGEVLRTVTGTLNRAK